MKQDFKRQMEQARALVEERLAQLLPGEGLEEAMRYSLLAGGKRLRPILTMKFCEAAGGSMEEALEFGCGVEMLHTYSLIHDDLPCMDNDDFRRGKLTNHKVYGECIATLAGDALQAEAFRTVLFARGPWENRERFAPHIAAGILATAVGHNGMCGGQYLDTVKDGESHTLEELTAINNAKTGALLRAACIMGVVASSGHREVDESCIAAAEEYATYLGHAFQIRDDILDVTSTSEALGKSVGSDAANQKTTYVTLLGVEGCKARVAEYTQKARQALEKAKWQGDTAFLVWLADELEKRES